MKTNLKTLQGLVKLTNLTGAICQLWKPDKDYRASIEINSRYVGIVGSASVVSSFLNAYLLGVEAGEKKGEEK